MNVDFLYTHSSSQLGGRSGSIHFVLHISGHPGCTTYSAFDQSPVYTAVVVIGAIVTRGRGIGRRKRTRDNELREKRERVPRPILDGNEANGRTIAGRLFEVASRVISPTLDSAGKTRPAAGRGTIGDSPLPPPLAPAMPSSST